MSLNNFLTYSLQIGLLIGVAGWIPAAARLRSPKARLAFFHALLVACLMLPALRPWKSEVIAIEAPAAALHATSGSTMAVAPRARRRPPRSGLRPDRRRDRWRALGCWRSACSRLRRYRLRSLPLATNALWSSQADIRVSARHHRPRHLRIRAARHSASRAFPRSSRGNARRHPVPRNAACAASRLAIHRRRRIDPRRTLVPPRHLVVARRGSTGARAGGRPRGRRPDERARPLRGCAARRRRRCVRSGSCARPALPAQAAPQATSRFHSEGEANVEDENHFHAGRWAGDSGRSLLVCLRRSAPFRRPATGRRRPPA